LTRLFISYRREEDWATAGRIFDRLSAALGREHVFMDIDTIEPGTDFTTAIDEAVTRADALLVVIGKNWTSVTDDDGRRRLDTIPRTSSDERSPRRCRAAFV